MSLLRDMEVMSRDKSVDLTGVLSCRATLFECLGHNLLRLRQVLQACDVTSLNYCFLDPYQAISGENFSQSEYVAFGAISQFAFPPLAKAIHRAFDYVNLSNLCSKQAFHSINLSNVGFIIESQSVRIHVSFRQKPINKLRFEAENSTDPYTFTRID